MKYLFFLSMMIFQTCLFAQTMQTPLEKNNFTKVTSYDELSDFVLKLDQSSDLLQVETIGKSVKGRNIYALKFSNSVFGDDKSKIRVLFFAQQHGNEQSGKEGSLLLAASLLKPENVHLFDKIDMVIVPQVNPDGSEANQRRNKNEMDLNRNHLILTEPETQTIHRLFDKYLFEVTMDVHEYYPWDENWIKLGYRKNSEVTVGTTTNINISPKIRDLSHSKVLPFMLKYLSDKQFSSFEYSPGGPPGVNYIRHSTFDINDGRQSLGIQNTFSFIQEGMNGEDALVDNIQNRARGQMTGMMALLEFVYQHKSQIKKTVISKRKKLERSTGKPVAIQMEHVANGENLNLPVYSYLTGKDSMVVVNDYRPVVKSLLDVKKPVGYLIPKSSADLLAWTKRHNLNLEDYRQSPKANITQYFIAHIDSMDFEGDIVVNPQVELRETKGDFSAEDYYFISTANIKGNMLVTALEPKSELGLVTYRQFAHYLKSGEYFPVLRVEKE